jgi:hypothetical protein
MAHPNQYTPYRFPHQPSKEAMQRRRKRFEREIAKSLRAEASARAERSRDLRALSLPILQSASKYKGDEARAAIERLRGRREERRKLRLAVPEGPQVKAYTRFGSFTQVFTAPYDFSWTPTATTGSPSVGSSADPSGGAVSYNISSSFYNSSSANVWAGVGVYWSIPEWLDQTNGTLNVTASIAYNYSYDDWVMFDNVGTYGQVVLNVDSYDLSGGWQGLPISSWAQLYNDGGGNSGQGSNSAYSLSGQTQVDSAHFYNIWLFINGSIFADGAHNFGPFFFWGSGADGIASATLNSLTVEFG